MGLVYEMIRLRKITALCKLFIVEIYQLTRTSYFLIVLLYCGLLLFVSHRLVSDHVSDHCIVLFRPFVSDHFYKLHLSGICSHFDII